MTITDKHVLFFGGVLCNWYRCRINVQSAEIEAEFNCSAHKEGMLEFSSSEHLFMYMKAIMFNDLETAKRIYEADTPKDAKVLGRSVKGFDDEVWKDLRCSAMMYALMKKMSQCDDFAGVVMSPMFKNLSFVECNPMDRIWGIGLPEDDPRADNVDEWKGLNLLGRIITEIRDSVDKQI